MLSLQLAHSKVTQPESGPFGLESDNGLGYRILIRDFGLLTKIFVVFRICLSFNIDDHTTGDNPGYLFWLVQQIPELSQLPKVFKSEN